MQSFEDKMDTAVHAAFTALGLCVGTHIELAYRLNDFITNELRLHVSDDEPDDMSSGGGTKSDRSGTGGYAYD